MKSYEELQAAMEAMEIHMFEIKKKERVNALKGKECLCK